MRIARNSIDRPLPTWTVILICVAGGIWGFLTLGRLEDPAFTIKQAVVETRYPGASAQQVARGSLRAAGIGHPEDGRGGADRVGQPARRVP